MVTAARSSVPTWPAKTWVMAPREYWHTEVKIAGAARYHSFLDSALNWSQKSPALAIGGMSPGSPAWATKVEDAELLWRSSNGSLSLLSIVDFDWGRGVEGMTWVPAICVCCLWLVL